MHEHEVDIFVTDSVMTIVTSTTTDLLAIDYQYVRRSSYERMIKYYFDEGRKSGAVEKRQDYFAAKESRDIRHKHEIAELQHVIKRLENASKS